MPILLVCYVTQVVLYEVTCNTTTNLAILDATSYNTTYAAYAMLCPYIFILFYVNVRYKTILGPPPWMRNMLYVFESISTVCNVCVHYIHDRLYFIWHLYICHLYPSFSSYGCQCVYILYYCTPHVYIYSYIVPVTPSCPASYIPRKSIYFILSVQ